MAFRDPVDDLNGLDAYDRMLASDMDDNCPLYGASPVLGQLAPCDNPPEDTTSAA